MADTSELKYAVQVSVPLVTREGRLVSYVNIPRMTREPEIIRFGGRYFALNGTGQYVEGLVWSVEMPDAPRGSTTELEIPPVPKDAVDMSTGALGVPGGSRDVPPLNPNGEPQ